MGQDASRSGTCMAHDLPSSLLNCPRLRAGGFFTHTLRNAKDSAKLHQTQAKTPIGQEAKLAGRKPGFRHAEEVRQKIQGTQLVNRLMDHINAPEPIMDASQVNAAKALLAKVIPDLKAVELTGSQDDGSIGITFKTVIEK